MSKGDIINNISANNASVAKKALEKIKQQAADLQKKQASGATRKGNGYQPPITRQHLV